MHAGDKWQASEAVLWSSYHHNNSHTNKEELIKRRALLPFPSTTFHVSPTFIFSDAFSFPFPQKIQNQNKRKKGKSIWKTIYLPSAASPSTKLFFFFFHILPNKQTLTHIIRSPMAKANTHLRRASSSSSDISVYLDADNTSVPAASSGNPFLLRSFHSFLQIACYYMMQLKMWNDDDSVE